MRVSGSTPAEAHGEDEPCAGGPMKPIEQGGPVRRSLRACRAGLPFERAVRAAVRACRAGLPCQATVSGYRGSTPCGQPRTYDPPKPSSRAISPARIPRARHPAHHPTRHPNLLHAGRAPLCLRRSSNTCEKPVIPSATCELKRPDSYVWQPKDARTPCRPPPGLANQNWSSISRPRMLEPSVYETP